MGKILVKVSEWRASKPYGEAGVSAQPVGDILYEIGLPEGTYTQDEDGIVLNEKGMKHVAKTLKASLYWDQDEEF